MRFLKLDEIKIGMRLAKPIYNTNGVMLYKRDTVVNESVLAHIKHINTYGQYILEPAEPLPPMTEDELEFERFTTVACNRLKEELDYIIEGKVTTGIVQLANEIYDKYGQISGKITFIQTLRSPMDSVYKHCLNTAILCALITNKLKMDKKEQIYLILAALFHDIGKLLAPPEIINKTEKLTSSELAEVHSAELKGYDLIKDNYALSAGVRRYLVQLRIELCNKLPRYANQEQVLLPGTKVLKIADLFDTMTAMRVYKEPISEFSAVQYLSEHEDEFDENIVQALTESIHILPTGCCVELSNGEKGLVISENPYYVLRPTVLAFNTNQIYDLGQKKVYEQIQIKGIMKTMDNRFVMQASNK